MSNSCGYADGKLMAVQKLHHAICKAQAEGTFDVLEMWIIEDIATTLVFDTAASNSGWKGGAAKLSEGLIYRKLFYHVYRLHIYELIF